MPLLLLVHLFYCFFSTPSAYAAAEEQEYPVAFVSKGNHAAIISHKAIQYSKTIRNALKDMTYEPQMLSPSKYILWDFTRTAETTQVSQMHHPIKAYIIPANMDKAPLRTLCVTLESLVFFEKKIRDAYPLINESDLVMLQKRMLMEKCIREPHTLATSSFLKPMLAHLAGSFHIPLLDNVVAALVAMDIQRHPEGLEAFNELSFVYLLTNPPSNQPIDIFELEGINHLDRIVHDQKKIARKTYLTRGEKTVYYDHLLSLADLIDAQAITIDHGSDKSTLHITKSQKMSSLEGTCMRLNPCWIQFGTEFFSLEGLEVIPEMASVNDLILSLESILLPTKTFAKLATIKRLTFTRNNHIKLAPCIQMPLPTIKELILEDNKEVKISHNSLRYLPTLTALTVRNNEKVHFSKKACKNTSLAKIEIIDNERVFLPKTLTKMPHLTNLNISNNDAVSAYALDLSALSSLRRLDCSHFNAHQRPAVFDFPTTLQELTLNWTPLGEPPTIIQRLPLLQRLTLENASLDSHRLKIVAPQLSSSLTSLDLSFNQITVLPKGTFGHLEQLRTLLIMHNQLTKVPSSKKKVFPSSLQDLFLNSNMITSIPKDAFKNNPHLKIVSLPRNNISTLSRDTIRDLPDLQELDIQDNPIKNVQKLRDAFPQLRITFDAIAHNVPDS